jgi:dTDP-4-amino-4,6-dideoxygalactose transaminase
VSNCTDGLRLILHALGIGPGDEVITVSHTFVATVAAVHHCGATPILVDIGDDHLIDPACIEAAITPRTKAVIPVHLNGRVSDMSAIMSIVERHKLILIEDAAQALGATFNGVKGGAFGSAAAFSFYPAKLLGAYGDAGAVTTNDDALADRLLRLRDHGREQREIREWAFNCRLDNLHAAVLDLKLGWFPQDIRRRREIAAIYDEMLGEVPQVLLPPGPTDDGPRFDVFQNYEIESADRDALEQHLKANGVETMRPWGGKGVHQFEALGLGRFSLPRTEKFFARSLMLPMHTELSDSQVEYAATCVRAFHQANSTSAIRAA